MKTLWTPWRVDHVLGNTKKAEHCIFEPPTDESHSKDHLLLLQNQFTVVLLNRFPYANGHLMVAPRRHIGCITEMTLDENQAVMTAVQECCRILKLHLRPDGFNIGCNLGATAGAGIADHLHIHVVPRWEGDHNFITILGDIRTIPEHIETTFDKLLPDFVQLNHSYPKKTP